MDFFKIPDDEQFNPIKTILISQPLPQEPVKSAYATLEKKYGIKIDFRSFIKVEPVTVREFRKEHINPLDFSGIIISSKHSAENYFRILEEMRLKPSDETKFFCSSEQVAYYLQRHIQFRKRKIFFPNKEENEDIKTLLLKYKKKENFLVPCSNLGLKEVTDFLKLKEFKYHVSTMYNTVSADLSDLADIKYDMIVFFSPQGPDSLFENFPDFVQANTRIGAYGKSTVLHAQQLNLKVNLPAPLEGASSITAAIEIYLKQSNKIQ